MRTILSVSGPFSIAAQHAWTVFYHTYGPLPATRGPFICYGRTSVPRTRPVFFHQDPEWTFLLTRASLHHSLHDRTFFYCLHSTRRQYPIKCMDFCPPRWTFLVRADLLSVIGGCLSLARAPFSFIRTRVDFSVHSRFACGPFSPRADLFLLLA